MLHSLLSSHCTGGDCCSRFEWTCRTDTTENIRQTFLFDQQHIFVSYAEFVDQINARLTCKRHAGAEWCADVAFIQIRAFVSLDADAMADAMRKGPIVSGIINDTTGSDVNIRCCVAQCQRRERLRLRFEDGMPHSNLVLDTRIPCRLVSGGERREE